jgi:hypothetical protein
VLNVWYGAFKELFLAREYQNGPTGRKSSQWLVFRTLASSISKVCVRMEMPDGCVPELPPYKVNKNIKVRFLDLMKLKKLDWYIFEVYLNAEM